MMFKSYLIPKLKDGSKTETRRVWKRINVKVGSAYPVMRDYRHKYREEDGFVEILEIRKQKLREMTEEDAKREGSPSLESFIEMWRDISSNWDPEQEVDVIRFKWIYREIMRLIK